MATKRIEAVAGDVRDAIEWLQSARSYLDHQRLSAGKVRIQNAKKLIDEAVVDLDGLIQDHRPSYSVHRDD